YYSYEGLEKQKIVFHIGKSSNLSVVQKFDIPQNLSLYFSVAYDDNCFNIYENKKITFFVENKKYTIITNFSEDLRSIFKKIGLDTKKQIFISKNDKISKLRNFSVNPFFLSNAKIYFPQKLIFVFKNQEYTLEYYSFYGLKDLEKMIINKIKTFLKKEGIYNIKRVSLVNLDQDFIPVSLSTNLQSRVGVNIEYIKKIRQIVNYDTKIVYTQNLKQDQMRVLKDGKNGKIEKIYSVILDFEGNVDKELISKKFLEYPEDKVVEVGIAPYNSLNGKYYLMESTGYTSEVGGVGYYTFTGRRVRRGVAAVDPSVIPLGTKLYVEGYGYATALDTGSSIKGFKIDLYFETLQEALQWGRKKVKVYILD
ncbi:MAG: 3D domain-containing protein, partial [bacterium]